MSENNTGQKSKFDWVYALMGLVMPMVLLYLGHLYKTIEAREGLHEKYVEMALDILQEDPDPSKKAIREWALEILDAYSEVPIDSGAQQDILEGDLPDHDKSN